ncbi:MAG: hypothetical protein ACT4PT_02230 [Methanobacteriota archaeon]
MPGVNPVWTRSVAVLLLAVCGSAIPVTSAGHAPCHRDAPPGDPCWD